MDANDILHKYTKQTSPDLPFSGTKDSTELNRRWTQIYADNFGCGDGSHMAVGLLVSPPFAGCRAVLPSIALATDEGLAKADLRGWFICGLRFLRFFAPFHGWFHRRFERKKEDGVVCHEIIFTRSEGP